MVCVRGCIQKFPDWPPGARTANSIALWNTCSCNAILWVSLVSFAAITICVASQRVFIVVVISLFTQSGNFWIHPRTNWQDNTKEYVSNYTWVKWVIKSNNEAKTDRKEEHKQRRWNLKSIRPLYEEMEGSCTWYEIRNLQSEVKNT